MPLFPLWPRPLDVSPAKRDWIADCFDWFDSRFPAPPAPILPTRAFFGAKKGSPEDTARQVLSDVTRHMGFDLPITLFPLERPPAELRHDYQSLDEVGGTYFETDEGRFISYDPETLSRPIQFINTMAHEVMHARLSGLEDQIPGGIEAHELGTDLGCIIAGFGVFQLQAADDLGWAGYLSQPTRAYALARFLLDRNLDLAAVSDHLTGRCRNLVRRGLHDVARTP